MSKFFTSRGSHGGGYAPFLILCALAVGMSVFVLSREDSSPTDPEVDTPVLAVNPSDTAPTSPQGTTKPSSPSTPTTPTTPTTPPETAKPTEPKAGKLATCLPVQGTTVTDYAMEVLCYNQTTRDWRTHNGIDLAADPGTSVCAAADGQVYTVYSDEQMGTTVVIRHADGYVTKYASLSEEVAVSPGDTVTMGQQIGAVGTTALMENALADHVHFSVTHNDEPLDPSEFLSQ